MLDCGDSAQAACTSLLSAPPFRLMSAKLTASSLDMNASRAASRAMASPQAGAITHVSQSAKQSSPSMMRTTAPTLIVAAGFAKRKPPKRPRSLSTKPALPRSCATLVRWFCEMR